MKKIGIVTISYGNNYGNKLQNYAMQEIYLKLGYDVETIKFIPKINKVVEFKSKLKRISISLIINKINKIFNSKKLNRIYNNRKINFDEFNKKINFSKKIYNNDNYKELKDKYDIYSAGSDQIWNPEFSDFSDYYLLDFIKENKIAYAPSFGISKLKEKDIPKFKNALKSFSSLSIREESGKAIIKKLIDKEVKVVLDPTMLLEVKYWDKILKFPKELENKKFVFTYFLGGINKERKKEIDKLIKKNNYELVDVSDTFSSNYSYGPEEFIGLIKNSEIVLTDSFHAVVFSSLYNKEFIVFSRINQTGGKMNSRIDTLLSKFNIKNRYYNGNFENIEKIDYNYFNKEIKKEREDSINYLKEALKRV